MIRVVLAVALATALLAASTPAIERAAHERSEATVRNDLDRLDAAALDLVRREEPIEGAPGPRRVVSIRIPERGWAAAGVEYVRVDPGGDRPLAYRIDGGRERTVPASAPLVERGSGDAVVLREPGRHRLAVRFRDGDVTVHRVR